MARSPVIHLLESGAVSKIRDLILFLMILGYSGCSSIPKKIPPEKPSPPPPPHETSLSREEKDYDEIERLFARNLYSATETKVLSFFQLYPNSQFIPSVENIYGLLLLQTKKPAEAALHFRKATTLNSKHPSFVNSVYFNLATAELEANEIQNAEATTQKINLQELNLANRIKVYYLKANLFDKKGLPLETCRQLLTGAKILPDPDSQNTKKLFAQRLDQELEKLIPIQAVENLLQEFNDSPLADSLLFKLGTTKLPLGHTGNEETYLRTLITQFPQSSYYAAASELLSQVQSKLPVNSRTIGILLPVKGKFGKFGLKSLQGIQLAFGIFNISTPDSKIKLVIEDSGETPEQALNGFNRLIFKHQVVAVIGPMLTKGVDQVAQRAQELGVPLISLARRESTFQDYVFQGGLTQQLQAQQIAQYAFHSLGARRFAMIYPNEKIGLESSQSFWDTIQALGGKIVGAETYNPGETDFRQVVDKLSGLYYGEARSHELELLAQERAANKIIRKTRKNEQFYRLKPIVDYDAVFIPDDPRIAGQILPTFAYRDVENVKFLGTSSWNSSEFLSRAQSYAEHATFVDAFFPHTDLGLAKAFTDEYQSTYAQEPSSLEALAYDAGLILKNIITSSSKNLSRSELRDQLKLIHEFPGVTGKISYRNGQFFRELTVIRVKNGNFLKALQTQ